MVQGGKLRDVLRTVGWNALLVLAGIGLTGLAGEIWLRSTVPFRTTSYPTIFIPNVGFLLRPDAEVRWTNQLDFWTVSRTNSLGFLDREPREPLSPERAAERCHVVVVGDSFVEARQVSIAEKFHIRLEELAARELPHLDIATTAIGMGGTGQADQLALYEYAKPRRPKLVVLVLVPNDFIDNFPLWRALRKGLDPEHLPYASPVRTEDGGFRWHPPDPNYQQFKLPRAVQVDAPVAAGRFQGSWLWTWLSTKYAATFPAEPDSRTYAARIDALLARHPAFAPLLDSRLPPPLRTNDVLRADEDSLFAFFAKDNALPFYEEALAFTAFAWDEFKARAERDGARLAILVSHRVHSFSSEGMFAWVVKMAAERGIPVIDQAEAIKRQGAELRDAGWRHNDHWSPRGHDWAAEVLLEYVRLNEDVCE